MKNLFSIKNIGLSFLLLLVLVLGLYQQNIRRLYITVTLYEQDKIVENFRSMYEWFNATRIEPSTQPFHFPVALQALPDSFSYQGQVQSTLGFLALSQTTGLLVLKDGKIVYEGYFLGHSESQAHISFSVAKSFVSALVGIAVDEGYIQSIDQAVTDYVPELMDSGYAQVRIKDILQMSSGVRFNEDYADFDSDINRFSRATAFGSSLDEFAASLIRQRPPGTFHQYVSIDTQVLGMLLTRATGVSLTDYLSEKIWQPLGMEHHAYWLADDTNMELALGGLNVTLRDYAKFGWLYLKMGQWTDSDGQVTQVLPRQWISDSVTPDAAHLMPGLHNPQSSSSAGYGYQWWIPLDAQDEYAAQGIYGQYIYVDPDQNLVIIKNAANDQYTDKSLDWTAQNYAMFRAISGHFAEP